MNWLQLQFTPCEALPSVWIGFAWQYSQACAHPCCLCTFSYAISFFKSTLHLICFDTALLEHPPLSVMTRHGTITGFKVYRGLEVMVSKPLQFSVIPFLRYAHFFMSRQRWKGLTQFCAVKSKRVTRPLPLRLVRAVSESQLCVWWWPKEINPCNFSTVEKHEVCRMEHLAVT